MLSGWAGVESTVLGRPGWPAGEGSPVKPSGPAGAQGVIGSEAPTVEPLDVPICTSKSLLAAAESAAALLEAAGLVRLLSLAEVLVGSRFVVNASGFSEFRGDGLELRSASSALAFRSAVPEWPPSEYLRGNF
jgi:hypothetical protein